MSDDEQKARELFEKLGFPSVTPTTDGWEARILIAGVVWTSCFTNESEAWDAIRTTLHNINSIAERRADAAQKDVHDVLEKVARERDEARDNLRMAQDAQDMADTMYTLRCQERDEAMARAERAEAALGRVRALRRYDVVIAGRRDFPELERDEWGEGDYMVAADVLAALEDTDAR